MRITRSLVMALATAFAIGVVGGYAVRAVSTPVIASTVHIASACPAGTHAVVWYTARTWACLPNS